jgi:hypothetical protein
LLLILILQTQMMFFGFYVIIGAVLWILVTAAAVLLIRVSTAAVHLIHLTNATELLIPVTIAGCFGSILNRRCPLPLK